MRKLKSHELKILKFFLELKPHLLKESELDLDSEIVEELDDGGMGSIRFTSPVISNRKLGETIAEAEFLDKDNIPVLVSLNLDQLGNIYEIDIWKADFTPVLEWPQSNQLVLTESNMIDIPK
jgi:hypothetical protein